jgi:hypothetical protein
MAMAHDMGAMTDLNLTDTVTHLVASEFTSEKYKVRLFPSSAGGRHGFGHFQQANGLASLPSPLLSID